MRWILAAVLTVLICGPAQAGQDVTYDVGGQAYEGYLAKADSDPGGLVVIVHDWDGLTDYEKKRADMLAELGYNAFALDLFGKGVRPTDITGKKAETAKLYKDRAKLLALMKGGLAEAQSLSGGPAVVIGYCFGGAGVLELARSGQAKGVKGYATFHGSLATPPGESYPAGTPPLFIAHGGADTVVPLTDVTALAQQLEKARIKYEIQIYSGAPHAFTVFGASSYREDADEKSWDGLQAFLEETLEE